MPSPRSRRRPVTSLPRLRDATMRYVARKNLFEAVAIQCGITAAAVRHWDRVPPKRVRDVERAIGRPKRLIRPDIYA